MIFGRDLHREAIALAGGESMLLLNPRWPAPLRERVLSVEFPDLASHVWVATSGTSGQPKIVALSRLALAASARAVNRHLAATRDDVWLNPLPPFHVGGFGIVLRAEMTGAVCRTLADWNVPAFVRQAGDCGATLSALVPAQVHDLVAAGLPAPPCLRAVVVGGGALDPVLRERAAALGWPLLPSYGLTEAASQAATARIGGGESEWLPLLDHIEARVGGEGALELRGASLLTGWMVFDKHGQPRWEDPKRDGWYRTSDRVDLRGREVRVLGRLDDLVKIRGELVDVAALERDLQARVASGRIAVCLTPDERNGFALRVVAETEAARDEAARAGKEVFPAFARPESVVTGVIERTALGKTVRR